MFRPSSVSPMRPFLGTHGVALAMISVCVLSTIVTATPSSGDQGVMRKGISFPSWTSGEYSSRYPDFALADLAATGANWVAIMVTGFQNTVSSTALDGPITPSDADLLHAIAQAHNLGLKVMLKPHVDLTGFSTWRGFIGQGFTEEQWGQWFGSYQAFVNYYAQFAQDHGVELFCVGVELQATQQRANDWRNVIAGVRSRYRGPITYAATNGWPQVAGGTPAATDTDIRWWDAVDYIGVDAYYGLTNEKDPTLEELRSSWRSISMKLAELASTWNKPVIFPEIGYRSLDGANRNPGDYQVKGEVDVQEQADCYRAAFEAVYDQPWFRGMFWWSWDTRASWGGPCNDDYTPHLKPAEDVLREWYGGPPGPGPAVALQPDYSRVLEVYDDELSAGWADWSSGATVDLAASDKVHGGSRAISVASQAWGGLYLHHDPIPAGPFYWLEFFVFASTPALRLQVSLEDEEGMRPPVVLDCRHVEAGTIDQGVWKRVMVPLDDLGARGISLVRLNIQNFTSAAAAFSIDDIRFVSGKPFRIRRKLRSSQ